MRKNLVLTRSCRKDVVLEGLLHMDHRHHPHLLRLHRRSLPPEQILQRPLQRIEAALALVHRHHHTHLLHGLRLRLRFPCQLPPLFRLHLNRHPLTLSRHCPQLRCLRCGFHPPSATNPVSNDPRLVLGSLMWDLNDYCLPRVQRMSRGVLVILVG